MKKTFLAKRNTLLSSTNISWGAFALALVCLLILLRLLTPHFFWYAFTPVFHLSDALAKESRALFASFGNVSKLALQNEKLMEENAVLALKNQNLLQRVNSFSGIAGGPEGIIAGVIARPPQSPYDSLVLAAGSEAGITVGMEAFGEGGIPLGIVSAVLGGFSRVTLFSTSGVSTNGWVGAENLPLAVRGAGAGAFTASVPRSAGITSGDIVSVPGPGNLPVGVVARVDSDPSSPSVILRITPAFNIFSVTYVVLRDVGTELLGAFSSTSPMLP